MSNVPCRETAKCQTIYPIGERYILNNGAATRATNTQLTIIQEEAVAPMVQQP